MLRSSRTLRTTTYARPSFNIGNANAKRFASSKKKPAPKQDVDKEAKQIARNDYELAFAYSLRELRSFYGQLAKRTALPADLNADFRNILPEYKNKNLISEEDLDSIVEVQKLLKNADEKLRPIEEKLKDDIEAVAPKDKKDMNQYYEKTGLKKEQIDNIEEIFKNPNKLQDEMSGLEDMYKQLVQLEKSLKDDPAKLAGLDTSEEGQQKQKGKKKAASSVTASGTKKKKKKKKKSSKDKASEGKQNPEDMDVPGMGSMADLMKQMAEQDPGADRK